MSKHFGTDAVGGLNVGLAAHKIQPHELTVSDNGWTDEEGVWRVAKGPDILYQGYDNIRAFAAGRMDGEDHLVWLDGTTLYDNGNSVGTVPVTGDSVKIRDFDDRFLIYGDDLAANYIYDGDHIRQQGAHQNTADLGISVGGGTQHTITAVTEAATTTITIGAHTIAADEWVYISGMTGLGEMEGRHFQVDSATATEIVIAENSVSYDPWVSGGEVALWGCGLSGRYTYYATSVVELASGRVLEGAPVVITPNEYSASREDGDALDLSVTDTVQITLSFPWGSEASQEFEISGTRGTDYTPGGRIYRTKSDGSDFYLEAEFWHDDSDFVYSGVFFRYTVTGDAARYSMAVDGELGAACTHGTADHMNAPQSSVMAQVGQRLYMNDVDNPGHIYFTHLDGIEYVPTLNFLTIPDDVTGIGSTGTTAIVTSADRIWTLTMLGGIPDMDELVTDVGLDTDGPMLMTSSGLILARPDGLWVTNGSSPPQCISHRAFASLAAPAALTAYENTLFVSGSEKAYLARRINGNWHWHESRHTQTMADATNGRFYAADQYNVYELFAGEHRGGALETRAFFDIKERRPVRVILDVSGDTQPEVWLNGNRISDWSGHTIYSDDADDDRRLVDCGVQTNRTNHIYVVRVEVSGEGAVYGVWVEASE